MNEINVDTREPLVHSETYSRDVFTMHESDPDCVLCNGLPIVKGDNVIYPIIGSSWTIHQVMNAITVRGHFAAKLQARNECTMKPAVWLPPNCTWRLVDGEWYVHENDEPDGDDSWGPVPASDKLDIYRALIEAREFLDACHAGLPHPRSLMPKHKAWTLPTLPRGYTVLAKPEGIVLQSEKDGSEMWIHSCVELLAVMHLVQAYSRDNRDDWEFIASGSFDLERLEGDHRGYK